MNEAKPFLALNRLDAQAAAQLNARLSERVARRHRTQGNAAVIFYCQPLEIVRASGRALSSACGESHERTGRPLQHQ